MPCPVCVDPSCVYHQTRDTCVGDEKVRGVSGGEKKRLAIGCELISSPSLLFLDEPTTGLDSFQAEKVRLLDARVKPKLNSGWYLPPVWCRTAPGFRFGAKTQLLTVWWLLLLLLLSFLQVVATLKDLASSGHTVVCSIHQPRSSIFGMFDDLLLLSEGRCVYFGPAEGVLGYFEQVCVGV